MYPKPIRKLIDLFSKFPTVGPRTAARFVFYLLKIPQEEVSELIDSISNLRKQIKICSLCFNPFQGENDLCQICQDPARDRNFLLIVEKETDLIALEKTRKYNGLYFLLGGTVLKLKKPTVHTQEDIQKLRIKELEKRVKNHPEIQEIILATNPTTEGEATSLYLERLLKPLNKKITRLGRGLPVGGELEYADEETLGSALEGRK